MRPASKPRLGIVAASFAAAFAASSSAAADHFDVTLEVEAASNPPGLAFTGAPLWALFLIGVTCLLVGFGLVLASRDRRVAVAA